MARWLTGATLLAASLVSFYSFAHANANNNQDAFTVEITPVDIFPPVPVSDLRAQPGAAEAQAFVQWTAPVESAGVVPTAVVVSSYTIRFATFPITELGGDATAWFNAATEVLSPPSPLPPSFNQSLLTTLSPAVTYWFALTSTDDSANTSPLDDNANSVIDQASVAVKGIAPITNVTGVAHPTIDGGIRLTWTGPSVVGATAPLLYEVRISSLNQINDDGEFDAAQPLSQFSPSTIIEPSGFANLEVLDVTGLTPGVSYFFAIREVDSGLPFIGAWKRDIALNINDLNFATARFTPTAPERVTNLSALPGSETGALALTWTAPFNTNGVPIDRYIVKINTVSVADVGGSTTTWFNLATSSVQVLSALRPGSDEFTEFFDLNANVEYFAGLISIDIQDEVSEIDFKSATVIQQARSRPRSNIDIFDLTALKGVAAGSIRLEWTEPDPVGLIAPLSYDIRVSTLGNISTNFEFNAAQPLSAFSGSPLPVPGAGGVRSTIVTGLTPFVTYYFAIRETDSNTPPIIGGWERNVGLGFNVVNSTTPTFLSNPPEAITDLAAVTGNVSGEVDLSWTAPENINFVPIASYLVRFSTVSIADIGGNVNLWFDGVAAPNERVFAPAQLPGAAEQFIVTGLRDSATYYFAVKAVDVAGDISDVDSDAAAVFPQEFARAFGIEPIEDLVASTEAVQPGRINLNWSAPDRANTQGPENYVIKVSSIANIENDAQFAAAEPLSALSGSPIPGVTGVGQPQSLSVSGLTPFVTYYFAIRAEDSSATPVVGKWLRDVPLSINATNFAPASFIPNLPDPVSNLTSVTGSVEGEIDLSWTAPKNDNFIQISSYIVTFATFSVAEVGGSTTAWLAAAPESRILFPAASPSALENFTITGLEPGALYFFGLRSVDVVGEISEIDLRAPGPQADARANGIEPVTDLVAQTFAASNGEEAGRITLNWTTPFTAGEVAPVRYVIRASSVTNINNNTDFAAATPLSSLSDSALPPVALGGSEQIFEVTGLTPFVTYYFAIRTEDSAAPQHNGVWLRNPAISRNTDNFAAASFFPDLPLPISDLTALEGGIEGEVQLSWTAPLNKNRIPIDRYEVHYATFPIVGFLGGDTTAWFNATASSAVFLNNAQEPGALENLTINNLSPEVTFYFAVKSIDELCEVSPVDDRADPLKPGTQAFVKPRNLPPATPTGLAAVPGFSQVELSWSDLTDPEKGLDFDYYRLERSTDDVQFVSVTTQTALTYLDRPLSAFTTFYYRLVARDLEGLESAPSSPSVSVIPFTLAPQEPFGISFAKSSTTVTMTWNQVRRFADRTDFADPDNPSGDELNGYRVLRSTDGCADFQEAATFGTSTFNFNEAISTQAWFYRIDSFNDHFVTTSPVVLSPFGQQNYFVSDCVTRVVIEENMGAELLASQNPAIEEDILLERRLRPEEIGGKVIQSAVWTPLLGGHTPLENFAFSEPITVVMHFSVDGNGAPVPATQAQGTQSAGSQVAATPAADQAKHLGIFWHNGQEFKKLYGKVDLNDQVVTAQTPNVGQFELRTQFREQGVVFDLSNITSRIFTPNGDGKNDIVIFSFDNPNNSPVEGKIYDLRGMFVAHMTPGVQPNSLQWDGRMNGQIVTSGVYVYQIKGEGEVFNGTIVVAR